MPYFLADKTGLLGGSEFTDVNDRMRLVYRCTAQDSTGKAYIIYDSSVTGVPSITLDFGSDDSLGTISFGSDRSLPMKKYLTKVSMLGSSKNRKFTGLDGEEYRWKNKSDEHEWTCYTSQAKIVAYYDLKLSGEPTYGLHSGCCLSVEEEYGHMACEYLASLMIMRHIDAHDL